MRRRRLGGWLAALALAGCAAERAAEGPEAVAVEAAVRPESATLGDLVTWTVTVRHPPGFEVEIAEPEAAIEGLGRLDVRRESRRPLFAPRVEELVVTLRAEELGRASLPPLRVTWRPAGPGEGEGGAAESPALAVEVVSVLPADGSARDIRDLKPLRLVEGPWPRGWLLAGALALLAAALAFWWWRRRRGRAAPAVPAPPPHEVALAALEALGEVDAGDPGAVRRFHFAVSEVVRTYVEGRFDLNATDLTTQEIVVRLGELEGLAAGEAELLAGLLQGTDRVKFAHDRPGAAEIEATRAAARRFVESTRPIAPAEREAA